MPAKRTRRLYSFTNDVFHMPAAQRLIHTNWVVEELRRDHAASATYKLNL
jgi:hypothetical protein